MKASIERGISVVNSQNFEKHKAWRNLAEARKIRGTENNAGQPLSVGQVFEHCDGGVYQIESLIRISTQPSQREINNQTVFNDATGYEESGEVGRVELNIDNGTQTEDYVAYTQHHAGGFKKGTLWLRKKSDFLSSCEKENVGRVPKFSLM